MFSVCVWNDEMQHLLKAQRLLELQTKNYYSTVSQVSHYLKSSINTINYITLQNISGIFRHTPHNPTRHCNASSNLWFNRLSNSNLVRYVMCFCLYDVASNPVTITHSFNFKFCDLGHWLFSAQTILVQRMTTWVESRNMEMGVKCRPNL